MPMIDPTLLAALISALVSLVVAIVSYLTNRRALIRETERVRFEAQRRLTEKLYDKRMNSYPAAFELTDDLRGEVLFSDTITVANLRKIRSNLLEWNRNNGFVMSDQTIESFYLLRRLLHVDEKDNNSLSPELKEKLFEAKNKFRRHLRNDVNLLYVEERQMDKF